MTTLATEPRTNRADPLTWTGRAACAGHPEVTDSRTKLRAEAALALCRRCPVLEKCRAWADAEGTYVGVAGGRVYTERRSAA